MKNPKDRSEVRITPKALKSLTLPGEFDKASHKTALDIDAILTQEDRPRTELDAKVAVHRDAVLSHLTKFYNTQALNDALFLWPPHLYIPKGANYKNYWFSPAPDNHRYGLEWISPATATANKASSQDGTLSSYSILHQEKPGSSQSSESGIGIFYTPSMSLGVIDLQPHVNCMGTLRTLLEFYPDLAAGYVEVKAQLLLAAWQQIPGGFDLVGFKQFDVATSGRRDQSHGPELNDFQNSFAGSSLSAPFVVQAGRTYLLGVVNRISVKSTLTSNTGAPLRPIDPTKLRVWGVMNCVVPQIDVITKRVDIP